jgi:hypothetical protein
LLLTRALLFGFIVLLNEQGFGWAKIGNPIKAIPVELLLLVLDLANLKFQESVLLLEKNRWIVFHTYVTICYVLSLRGCKGFLLDLAGLNQRFAANGDKYVVIVLLGKIKGKSGDRAHLLPTVPTTSSGIKVRLSLEHLMEFKYAQGFIDGPAISDLCGNMLSHGSLNEALLEILKELFDTHQELFPASIADKEMLRKRVQIYRTLRWTLDTRALKQKVAQSDIDEVDRWKALECADGNRPHCAMRQHYAELELLLGPFLRYTWAM